MEKSSNILTSPLFKRFFYLILATVLGFTALIYLFAVPYLKNIIYSMEEKTAQTLIHNVGDLVKANFLAIEAYEKSARKAEEKQIKNITLFEETFLANKYEQFRHGILPEDEARLTALEELRKFRYGNNDYVWVADLSGRFISHPDPQMNMADFSKVRDVFGNYVLTPLIDEALQNGEGYHTYWWQRLDQDLPAEKLSYARLFPQWGMVLGTGVYLDDLKAEVILRREKMTEELRAILTDITRDLHGFIFVFDSFDNIIIHPDTKLENSKLSDLINPQTGNPLSQDLTTAAESDSQKLEYLWDSPEDKGNYIHNKIAWVQFVEGLNWYIVFTVDTKALNESSVNLRNMIFIFSTLISLISIFLIALMIGRLIKPIRQLSNTALKIEDGDLSARCKISSQDEVGLLATSFNSMVERLKSNIDNLDRKVLERTQELDDKNMSLETEVAERKKMQEQVGFVNQKLTSWVNKLEVRNREITLLNRMAEMLQSCRTLKETFPVTSDILKDLFPSSCGALFMHQKDEIYEPVASWGDYPESPLLNIDNCWGIKLGKLNLVEAPGHGQMCSHLHKENNLISLCLPLHGQNMTIGLLHILFLGQAAILQPDDEHATILQERERLATAVSDHLAMAQANLILRERLHNLSVRDALTGLFNRRYMEETLEREFNKAHRNKSTTGVIMLDVDFFKKFNDLYGHETGDIVLVELGKAVRRKVRIEDVVCRYGGEEFLIILPEAPLNMVCKRAEQIRQAVEDDIEIGFQGEPLRVTVSLGVAIFPDHGETQEEILKAADVALYQAKEAGRNQVVVFGDLQGKDDASC